MAARVLKVCVVCGKPLPPAARADRRTCSPTCRAEAATLRAILDGQQAPWSSIAARLAAQRRRGRAALLRAVDTAG